MSGCIERATPEYERVGANYEFKLHGEILFDKDADNGSVAYGYLYKQLCKTVDWNGDAPEDSKLSVFLSRGMIVPTDEEGKYSRVANSGYERDENSEIAGFEKWVKEENYPHGMIKGIYYFSEKPLALGGGYYYLNCLVNPGSTILQSACSVYYNALEDVRVQYGIRGELFSQFPAIDKCVSDFVAKLARPLSTN
jgi:hypothetical protein